jgi:cell division protein FtsI (penicillin-binding protein 3)
MKRPDPKQQEISFEALDPTRIRIEGARKQALEQGRTRLLVIGVMCCMAFVILGARLVDLTRHGKDGVAKWHAWTAAQSKPHVVARGEVHDRNGNILAITLPTKSLFINPKEVRGALTADAATDRLLSVLTDLDRADILKKIEGSGHFVWLARNLTPDQVWAVNKLGLPGFKFRDEERRVYPHGSTFAHVVGYTEVNGRGIAGAELKFDNVLSNKGGDVDLSVDLRVQAILHEELSKAQKEFNAKGSAGVVMDVNTGEILAMASLPDYDPNVPGQSQGTPGFNRATLGVYEMGSTFKLFTTATALDTGTVSLTDGYDATDPIKVARFTISDFHGKNRWLSVPEILTYSSNIGTAKMAMDVGQEKQKEYLERFGLLKSSEVELKDVGSPLFPARWGDISTMTISYGHGIAVSPLQIATGVAALVNGGIMIKPTVKKIDVENRPQGQRVLKPETSLAMRALMRKVVRDGTGASADIKGYLVGGKTGTANKQSAGGYDDKALISSFVGVFPMTKPRFVVLVMLDEPKGTKASFGYATGGWVASPAVGRVIERMGPIFGIVPDNSLPEDETKIGHPMYLPKSEKPGRSAMLQGGVTHAAY